MNGEGPPADDVIRYIAAGGVVVDGDRVLLLDRPSRSEVRLPKGHVEPGETAQQAAVRETAEESGYADLEVDVDLGSQLVSFEYDGRAHLRDERYFLMSLVGPARVRRGRKDRKQFDPIWVPLVRAEGLLTYEAEREWLRRGAAALSGSAGRAGGAATT